MIDPATLAALAMIIPALMIYMLPFIISLVRLHPQGFAIFFLNLLLGWTLLGWVVSLVWACTSKNKNVVVVQQIQKD